ncbi:MAG: adenylyl-sulfate reductase subunit alpha [Oscillospiraceae bacterium]|nr:adenylyl-sulfate reductase subunit alpha [Oscillospiraceae bacterium]
MKTERIRTDLLIIGGGTAGCWSAVIASENSDAKILICEKADIRRSGCLAAGVNALNAYITEGKTPADYAEYAKNDACGIARDDLLLTMSEKLNQVTNRLEELGLVILKDEQGRYVTRGSRNIKINGENIKPLLAKAALSQPNVTVLNRVNITDLAVENGRVKGAFGIGIENEIFYIIEAKAVIIASGGASGLYKPNNPGLSRHKMWYSPFNTGAGYAMGIKHGAEMTTFEMRFIALRCKDTIAPTGTLAQGAGAKQINSLGEVYETKYGISTSERVYGTVKENLEGRGPCFLRTEGISQETEKSLIKAYLNMAPSQTIKWIESGKRLSEQNVEIEGTEPYIVGGHTASGFWVDTNRATTLKGLFAAGDAAGGCPQKYVTGALAEGEIAAGSAVEYIKHNGHLSISEEEIEAHLNEAEGFLHGTASLFTAEQLEEAMQTVMDAYAGGIKTNYSFTEKQLDIADERIREIEKLSDTLHAEDFMELMHIYELRERLTVCRAVIAHLRARHETRWAGFSRNLDYPERDDANWNVFVNSVMENGEIKIILRDMQKEAVLYEHSN